MIWTNQLHFNLISVFLSEYFSMFSFFLSFFYISASQRQSYPYIPLYKQENTSKFHLSNSSGTIKLGVHLCLSFRVSLYLRINSNLRRGCLSWILRIICDLLHSLPYLIEVTSQIYSEMINSCKTHFKCVCVMNI